MKAECKNCGDATTFARSGDREPDYERELLGWCRRCWRIAFKTDSVRYHELVREAGKTASAAAP